MFWGYPYFRKPPDVKNNEHQPFVDYFPGETMGETMVFESLHDEYRPHPDYICVQVRDDFLKLRSMVVGDEG